MCVCVFFTEKKNIVFLKYTLTWIQNLPKVLETIVVPIQHAVEEMETYRTEYKILLDIVLYYYTFWKNCI